MAISFAQNSEFKGIVKDANTHKAIVSALVLIDGTGKGVYTDEKGKFSLLVEHTDEKAKVQAMGYETLVVNILTNQTRINEIYLNQKQNTLDEVVINARKEKYSKKNNPAVELIKKVIANKDRNNIASQDFYQYKEYERYIFAFNEFDPESGYFKRYKFLPNYVDTSITKHQPILPFSVKEKVTDIFYRRDPKAEKRIVKGQKAAGIDQKLEQGEINSLIEETLKTVDLNDNYITMLYQNFVSPLSEYQSVNFYKWYLSDTVYIDNDRYVKLDFAPFNNRDLGFTGNLYISLDSMYAVKKAVLKVPKNININFVNDMIILQDFKKDELGNWIPEEFRTAMDMSLYETLKIYVDKTVTVEDFMANMPIPPVYELPSPELYEKDYLNRRSDFWAFHRPENHKEDLRMEDMMEELKDDIFVKVINEAGNILMTGYIPLNKDPEINKLEIGTLPTFFSYNRAEGARFRVTALTTKNFNPNLFLNGYVAYGIKDNKFKYKGEAAWSFRKIKNLKNEFPVNQVSVGYRYDIGALGEKFTQAERDNIIRALSSSSSQKLTYNRQVKLGYHKEYYNGFSFQIETLTTNEKPAYNLTFEKYNGQGGITPVSRLQLTETSLMLRYAHNEKFVQRRRRRIPIPTEKFIISLDHKIALKDFLGGQYSYNKTSLGLRKDFWITPYGKLRVNLLAEKLWGEAPFVSLITPSANSSLTIQSGSFYMIKPLEFIHDKQVSFEIYYHMGGFIFNRIPILRELKWREVAGFRGFYGSLRQDNNPKYNHDLLVFPEDSYQTTNRVPYMEYNVGIENIFTFFRIDYVRRLNYLNHPDIDRYGFRFTFQMEF